MLWYVHDVVVKKSSRSLSHLLMSFLLLTVETAVFNSQQLFLSWCNSVVATVHYDFAV